MKKKLVLVVFVIVCLCGSAALALDPMGPPVAGHTQGQWSAGLDYAFSEMDLEFDGEFAVSNYSGSSMFPTAIADKLVFEALEMHKGYLNLGYGITDRWDAFFRLGVARAEVQKPTRYICGEWNGGSDWVDLYEDGPCHDFDTGYAIGFGTKATFWEDTNLSIGGIFQASWTKMDIRVKYQGLMESSFYPDGMWSVPCEGELELWELQFAVGATYELSPSFTIYGGPFWHYIDGNYEFDGSGVYAMDVTGSWTSINVDGDYDVKVRSEFGGFLGASIDVTDNVACNAECMLTGDAVGVGTSLIWRFN